MYIYRWQGSLRFPYANSNIQWLWKASSTFVVVNEWSGPLWSVSPMITSVLHCLSCLPLLTCDVQCTTDSPTEWLPIVRVLPASHSLLGWLICCRGSCVVFLYMQLDSIIAPPLSRQMNLYTSLGCKRRREERWWAKWSTSAGCLYCSWAPYCCQCVPHKVSCMLEGRRFSTQQHECQAGKIDLNSAICESHCCGSSALYSRLFHTGVGALLVTSLL